MTRCARIQPRRLYAPQCAHYVAHNSGFHRYAHMITHRIFVFSSSSYTYTYLHPSARSLADKVVHVQVFHTPRRPSRRVAYHHTQRKRTKDTEEEYTHPCTPRPPDPCARQRHTDTDASRGVRVRVGRDARHNRKRQQRRLVRRTAVRYSLA